MAEGKRPQGSERADDASRPPCRRRTARQLESSASAGTNRPGSRRSLPVCYRYRTAALVGPWRADPEQAIDDAVRARQAGYEGGGRFHWLVPGSIESSAVAADRVEVG